MTGVRAKVAPPEYLVWHRIDILQGCKLKCILRGRLA
jgi:hypothetical protein